ncbi:DUF2198 family protein [Bacillus sp. FJAT-45350]|uniref:DUF2198 family protein n=1 Tax=Bacillus sp. FJAT-45350 TaxID=2011014 RepID=UPI000BB6B424|nr:DUF2198 family protein [Bacillus sp. FJAT-45350]
MIDLLLALVLPFILMWVVTRVAFSIVGALIVTVMILVFALQFHERSYLEIGLALASLTFGWIQSKKLLRKKPGM